METEMVENRNDKHLIYTSILNELKAQRLITFPLLVTNFTWFARIAITTAFLGRLGELSLAGGTLGGTFANVTGFAVLSGLSVAMEPICGQAYGAKNFKLLHKTLVMSIFLLLLASIPISFLWLNVDKILIQLGQQKDLVIVVKRYLLFLLPDLVIQSILYPLKAYLSTQNQVVPIMLSSVLGLAFHIPVNVVLSKAKGLEGVSMGVWLSDLLVTLLLAFYAVVAEHGKVEKWKEGGWWEQGVQDWKRLLKLCGPCCLTTCLEWWCYEILMLLAARLPNAKQSIGVLAIVVNFDYLLYSVMISLATSASIRVSNELGANQARTAHRSAYISLGASVLLGFIGGSIMIAARNSWGSLFSQQKEITRNVKKMLLIMATMEVFNFPLVVCGGIVRGTARPNLAMYANLTGFYLFALPVAAILAFKFHLGVAGILIGFVVGCIICLFLLLIFIWRIDWDEEASKARMLTSTEDINNQEDEKSRNNNAVGQAQ
ncbi:OLC1v1029432C1 [Oldenlandia corymbosa var. corymbosa]|uniref:Protein DETOXIFICATION n=1 Tax=Oldenlandia corymbosa var. corymbosa TaxID=529605 RepID=A0AAV1CEC7_OLDCO|nr:OLC1v1029432C1 [Oldenlandia corymbosa var. corymbosa]